VPAEPKACSIVGGVEAEQAARRSRGGDRAAVPVVWNTL